MMKWSQGGWSLLLGGALLLGMPLKLEGVRAQTVLVQELRGEDEARQLWLEAARDTQQGRSSEAREKLQRVLSFAQSQQLRELEALALLMIGRNYETLGRPQQALELYRQALIIFQDIGEKTGEAATLNNLSRVYHGLGERQEALDYLNQALPILRAVQNRAGEAETLTNIGGVYHDLGQRQKALDYYNQALPMRREVQDRPGEAQTLSNIGGVYLALGEPQKALDYLNQALPMRREVQDRPGEAETLNNIGLVFHALGQPPKALDYYNQALPIWREVQNRPGEAQTLNNIGGVYNVLGERHEALNYYNRALSILQDVQDRAGEARTLNNIGGVYHDLGQPQEALNYYNQALPIRQAVQDRAGEATTLHNVGGVYHDLGQPQEALNYYNRALPILRAVQDRAGEARTLNNIGVVYHDLGLPKAALDYYNRALPIRQAVQDQAGEANTLTNIGMVYNTLGQPQEALDYLNQALPILRAVQNRAGEATMLHNVGVVHDTLGQPQEALDYYNQALPIRREVQDRAGEVETLNNIGLVYRDSNQPEQAIDHLEQSLDIILSMRAGLQKEFRDSFLQIQRGPGVALVDLLIEQNQAQRAFEWANRVTTYELADYNRLIGAELEDPEAQALLEQWNQKFQQVNALRQQLQEEFNEDLARQVRASEAELFQLAETLANNHPEAAELFEIEPEDLAQLQASLPRGTLVLHPVLLTGIRNVPDSIALFLLTRDDPDPLQVKKVPIDGQQFRTWIQEYRDSLENEDSNYWEISAQLYDYLIRPIEEDIAALNPQQLGIIATGKLRQIPFETLWDDQTESFLLEQYPIHYLTRLSSHSLLAEPRPQPLPLLPLSLGLGVVGLGLLVKSRPWGGAVLAAALVTGGLSQVLTPQYAVLGFANPKPEDPYNIPGTEIEVQNIAQLAPESQVFFHEAANLETFKTQSSNYRYLHLATHGCFQQLGCCLGDDCEDDFLLREIHLNANTLLFSDGEYPLTEAALLGLNQTELVALSACQTALQTYRDQDAIAGMAYLWERAGARSVMATLWSVDDRATQELMSEFYRLVIEEGLTKVEALRQVKLQQAHRHPYFWSPLVLIGDPR